MHEIVLRKHLTYHMYKPIPIRREISENLKLSFSGPKVLLFWLKVSRGNELAGDDVENCKNSPLALTLSHLL